MAQVGRKPKAHIHMFHLCHLSWGAALREWWTNFGDHNMIIMNNSVFFTHYILYPLYTQFRQQADLNSGQNPPPDNKGLKDQLQKARPINFSAKRWGRWKLQIVLWSSSHLWNDVNCESSITNISIIYIYIYKLFFSFFVAFQFLTLCHIRADCLHCCCVDCLAWASQRMPVGSGRSWGTKIRTLAVGRGLKLWFHDTLRQSLATTIFVFPLPNLLGALLNNCPKCSEILRVPWYEPLDRHPERQHTRSSWKLQTHMGSQGELSRGA